MVKILQILGLSEITVHFHNIDMSICAGTQYLKNGAYDYQEYFDSEIILPIRF